MRQTSIIAYRSVKESGIIGKRQKEVYDELFETGPATAKELGRSSGLDGAWKRLNELQAYGLIYEVGTRKCKITGREALEWDVTNRMAPTERIEKPRQESRKDLLKKIARLEIELQNARHGGQQFLKLVTKAA